MVQEDPEEFLSDVADFLLPDLVGSRTRHFCDEAGGRFFFLRGGVAEVGEESTSARGEGSGGRGGEVGEEEGDDDAAGWELRRAFFVVAGGEEQAEEGGEESRVEGGEVG